MSFVAQVLGGLLFEATAVPTSSGYRGRREVQRHHGVSHHRRPHGGAQHAGDGGPGGAVLLGAGDGPTSAVAVAYDLKVFFSDVVKQPADITTADVLMFIKSQRVPRRGATVIRLEDGEAGLSARTIKRRLASLSGLFEYLLARGDAGVRTNPVPRGLATRGRRGRAGSGVPR